MPSYPINDKPMSSAERSRRSILQQRQMMANVRTSLEQSADLLLKAGHIVANLGKKEEAAAYFQMAELQMYYFEIFNKKLAPHEKEIQETVLPDRRGRPVRDPIENLVITAASKQRTFSAQRAARRPEVAARYGHLAKAEKAEAE